jgi:hypothetical protein
MILLGGVLATLAASTPGLAAPQPVGIGVGAGFALPNGSYKDVVTGAENISKVAFNWGFYTDIPLLSTFHLTPSTLLYHLTPDTPGARDIPATDVSLSFKFMIPLGPVEPFAGVTAGVTSTDHLDPHVGLLGGVSVNILANIDIFAQVSYKLILADGGNIKNFQAFAGPLFRFWY